MPGNRAHMMIGNQQLGIKWSRYDACTSVHLIVVGGYQYRADTGFRTVRREEYWRCSATTLRITVRTSNAPSRGVIGGSLAGFSSKSRRAMSLSGPTSLLPTWCWWLGDLLSQPATEEPEGSVPSLRRPHGIELSLRDTMGAYGRFVCKGVMSEVSVKFEADLCGHQLLF
jgi:hypothetical protein